MIKNFDYQLDTDNLEIFSSEICQDPLVVFHGTSTFHSDNIEKNGFIKGQCPFDLKDGKELVRVLQLEEVIPHDEKSFIGMTTATTLESYINAIEKNGFRLSFSYLSSLCVLFSAGNSKGGQTIGTIRAARKIIDFAITSNPSLKNILTDPINKLFDLADEIERASGVVYAIQLPKKLEGITEENGVIYSDLSIPKELILGKVIIPSDIDLKFFDWKILNQKNKTKLIKNGNLGIILGKRKYYGDDQTAEFKEV